jgi:hypothetical protein
VASGPAVLGVAVFWLPYRLTNVVARIGRPTGDTLSTHKVLGGALIFVVWILLLSVVVGLWAGAGWGVAALVLLPVLAFATLAITERWQDSWTDARRFFTLRRRDDLLAELRDAQRSLAARLEDLRQTSPPLAGMP